MHVLAVYMSWRSRAVSLLGPRYSEQLCIRCDTISCMEPTSQVQSTKDASPAEGRGLSERIVTHACNA